LTVIDFNETRIVQMLRGCLFKLPIFSIGFHWKGLKSTRAGGGAKKRTIWTEFGPNSRGRKGIGMKSGLSGWDFQIL
jgi:hypothetical protein